MRFTNKHKIPSSIANTIIASQKEYDNQGSNLSASGVSASPRQYWLSKRHEGEMVVDVIDLFRSWVGTTLHSACEGVTRKNKDLMVEERLATTIHGWKVSGQVDSFNKKTGHLTDLKFSSISSLTNPVKTEYEQQVNTQAYLLHLHGYEVNTAGLDLSAIDWYKGRTKNPDYPKTPTRHLKIDVWPYSLTEQFLSDRVSLLQFYEDVPDDELLPCSPWDRWSTPTMWAWYKNPKNKRATKLFDEEMDAAVMCKKEGGKVEKREGVDRKCMEYCNAAPWCGYWKERYSENTIRR